MIDLHLSTKILIIALWIIYGVFICNQRYQTLDNKNDDYENVALYIFGIMFSPMIFVYRIIRGIFHRFD